MTNYSKWDKFDPDLVCKEIDVQQSIDSSKKAKKKAFVEAATINEQAVAAAKAAAEALQSQADVAALKLKGAGGRRKREKGEQQQQQPLPVDAIENVQAAPIPACGKESDQAMHRRSTAEQLGALTDFLYKLLKQVEQLRSNTEKKGSHAEGYCTAIRSLGDIRAFSRIKDATARATLRAMSSVTQAAAKSSLKILEDLDQSESFLIEQTANCLSLFALSRGEYALACDTTRFVLKRQDKRADAGIWIMRGLAFAGMALISLTYPTCLPHSLPYTGVPFLARLHFTSALSANADYAGLQEALPIVEAESAAHARRVLAASKQELVVRELARAVASLFESRAHILKAVADLSVITSEEVRNFLADGSLWARDPSTIFGGGNVQPGASTAGVKANSADNIHMEDGTEGAAAEDALGGTGDVSVEVIVSAVRRLIAEHSQKPRKLCDSVFATLLSNLTAGEVSNTVEVTAILTMLRRLFYEAQVLYLEGFHQSAAAKYCACTLLVQAARTTEDDAITTYLTRVEAICYANSAVCMLHKSAPRQYRDTTLSASTSHRRATSVRDLIGEDSGRGAQAQQSMLHFIDRAVVLWPVAPVLWRRILVLEHLHRFSEAIEQCNSLQCGLEDGLSVRGGVVSLTNATLVQGLAQQYFGGFALRLPEQSAVLSADLVELTDSASGGAGAEEAGMGVELEDLLAQTEELSASLTLEEVRDDSAVPSGAWRQRIDRKIRHLEFLSRKYGEQ